MCLFVLSVSNAMNRYNDYNLKCAWGVVFVYVWVVCRLYIYIKFIRDIVYN